MADPASDAADHAGDHSHEPHHEHGGVGKYLAVFFALCVLTATSFAIANSPVMDTPSVGWFLMMAVSCAKALLVILFFMHLLWEANWKYVLTIPASMMSLFLVLMLVPDIGLRTRKYSEERRLHAADARQEHDGEHHDSADHQQHDGHGEGEDAAGRDAE